MLENSARIIRILHHGTKFVFFLFLTHESRAYCIFFNVQTETSVIGILK